MSFLKSLFKMFSSKKQEEMTIKPAQKRPAGIPRSIPYTRPSDIKFDNRVTVHKASGVGATEFTDRTTDTSNLLMMQSFMTSRSPSVDCRSGSDSSSDSSWSSDCSSSSDSGSCSGGD